MDNYLKKICIGLGIDMIYTNNKVIVLSADVKNGVPILRAHKVFKGCSYKVAQAVVGYYTEVERRIVHKVVIEEYLKKYYKGNEFKLKKFNLKEYITSNMLVEDKHDVNDTSLEEFEVFYMTIKNFLGDEKKQEISSELSTTDNNLLELNIIVKPPIT